MSMTLEGVSSNRDHWRAEDCSIAKTFKVVGSRSTMLLVREAFYGTKRFADFADRAGVTEATASARLKQLVDDGIFEKRQYEATGARTRFEYVLTEKGRDLLPVILAMMNWGDRYLQTDVAPVQVSDRSTGMPVSVAVLSEDGSEVGPNNLTVHFVGAKKEPAAARTQAPIDGEPTL
ncbi:winged helix-turn-helix transcriptional regulator [Nocardia rhizosphaerihabitans]|uniref:winged helix-turn-helix transcriptional regulator n=1 Tax=Nocardia rhizosphaerihabitans TaxID=1691570 RepID=UPI003670C92F